MAAIHAGAAAGNAAGEQREEANVFHVITVNSNGGLGGDPTSGLLMGSQVRSTMVASWTASSQVGGGWG